MLPARTQHLVKKFGASIDHKGVAVEILDRVDESQHLGDPGDAVKPAQKLPGRGQQGQTGAHRMGAGFFSSGIAANLAGGEPTIWLNRALTGQEQKISLGPAQLEHAHGLWHFGQDQPKRGQTIFDG